MRPRSDLFVQHFLASRLTRDIAITHLFVEYKYWLQKEHPFATVRDELATLACQRDAFKRIIDPEPSDVIFRLASFLKCYDTSTAFPLLLQLFDLGISEDEWRHISGILESYLVRRAVCGFTAKRYNLRFPALTRDLKRDAPSTSIAARIHEYLTGLSGESGEWPSDDAFYRAWRTRPLYDTMKPQARLAHIFRALNDACFSSRHEDISLSSSLTIEHIMPIAWREHWLLPDGSSTTVS
jgi:hypothetical protein